MNNSSSLFFILLFCFSCINSDKTEKVDIDTISNSKYYKISRDKNFTFEKRKSALDSLIDEATRTSNTSSLTTQLGYKSYLYNTIKKHDSALSYAEKMLSHASLNMDSVSIAKSLFKIGLSQYKKNNFFEAYFNYNKSSNLFLKLKDSSQAGKMLLNMAVIQKKTGDFLGGETNAIKALKFLNEEKDFKHRVMLYHNLSVTSKEQRNYKEALYWNKKALETATDTLSIIKYKNTTGVIYNKQKDYSKAIEVLSQIYSFTILKHHKNIRTKARILDNLAYAKSKRNNTTAEKGLLEALKLRKEINDLSGQFASYIHLIEHYQDRDQNKIAIQYANNAYQTAKKINGAEAKVEILSYLIQLETNPKKAAIEYQKLTDSIYDARRKTKNQFAKIEYDTENTREQNLILKTKEAQNALQLTNEKSKRNILILLSCILLGGIFFIVYNWRQRIKTARIEERHNTNNRLSKKLHDEVGNDLYYLLLQLQKASDFTKDQENLKILKGFDTVYHKIRDFSRDNKVETGEEYGDELLSLLDSYGDEDTKIITSELETDFWTEVSPLKKEELYWILKELLTNMKRHSKASIVAMTFTKEKKKITVNYIDNGIGMNLKEIISKNGLRNVENRMKDINGTITFDSKPDEGFKATLVFAP